MPEIVQTLTLWPDNSLLPNQAFSDLGLCGWNCLDSYTGPQSLFLAVMDKPKKRKGLAVG